MRGETIDATQPANASFATWAGFGALCLGMFMAILDVQVVVTSLSVIQVALDIGADRMSWVQTSYLIAEIIAIPLTALLTRVLLHAASVCRRHDRFHARFDSLRSELRLHLDDPCTHCSGLCGRYPHSHGVRGSLSAVPEVPGSGGDDDGRHAGRAGADARSAGGRLDHREPFLALAVSDQRHPWHRRACWWVFCACREPHQRSASCVISIGPRLSRSRSVLAAFQIGLKNAPEEGWASQQLSSCHSCFSGSLAFTSCADLKREHPIVELRLFADRTFLTGCIMSFVLGAGLFGSVYLLPVFLAFVRGHGPLAIGIIMLVTGVTQMISAPLAVQLEKRTDERMACGRCICRSSPSDYGCRPSDTIQTDYDEMFWPQVVRGVGVTLCLLAPTRLALGHLPTSRVNDGSSLFNLMRNLGGAIGIALIDTVLFTRTPQLCRFPTRTPKGRRSGGSPHYRHFASKTAILRTRSA